MCRWINPRSLPFQPPSAVGARSYARRVAINLKQMRGQWLQTPRPSRSILSEKSSWDHWHGCIHERLAETASRAACWQIRWAMAKQPPPLGCYLRSRAKCQMSGQVGTLGQGWRYATLYILQTRNISKHHSDGMVASDSMNYSIECSKGSFTIRFNPCQESSNIDLVSPSLGRAVGRRILQVSGWRGAAGSPHSGFHSKGQEACGNLTIDWRSGNQRADRFFGPKTSAVLNLHQLTMFPIVHHSSSLPIYQYIIFYISLTIISHWAAWCRFTASKLEKHHSLSRLVLRPRQFSRSSSTAPGPSA